MFDFIYFGFGFEIRHSRWHIKVGRPLPAALIFALTTLGFGLSFVPVGMDYFKENRAQRWKSDDSVKGRQKDFDSVIRSAPFLRSLEVRTHTPLKFAALEKSKNLRSFYTSTRIIDSPNFSIMKNLVMIAGAHSSLQRIVGLENLEKLIYVHVSGLKVTFLNRLPVSLQSLFLRNSIPKRANFLRFKALSHISFSDCAELDLGDLGEHFQSVTSMDISGVRSIVNMDLFQKVFPNVRRVAMVPENIEQFDELRRHLSAETDVRM